MGVVDLPGEHEPGWAVSLRGDIAWRSNGGDLSRAVAASRVDTIVFHVDIRDQHELAKAIGRARTLRPSAKLLLAAGPADALLLAELISEVHPNDSQFGGTPALTAREDQVMGEIRSGQTNREIAGSLGISLSTVNRHVESILKKLSARNRAQAVAETEVLRHSSEPSRDERGLSVL
jgi:DNA-binding CsgD family transcriptional regulator